MVSAFTFLHFELWLVNKLEPLSKTNLHWVFIGSVDFVSSVISQSHNFGLVLHTNRQRNTILNHVNVKPTTPKLQKIKNGVLNEHCIFCDGPVYINTEDYKY